MTPDQARALLDGTTPGDEWHYRSRWGRVWRVSPIGLDRTFGTLEVSEEDAALIVAAPTLAAMIAGMREEWGVAVTYPGLAEVVEWGYSIQAGALEEVELASTAFGAEYRIVRRYVTEQEVCE